MTEISDNYSAWFQTVLVCPACLSSGICDKLCDRNGLKYYQCSKCNRIYPRDEFNVIDFQVVDRILSLPEPYLGIWALAQQASLEEYQNLSPASISTPEREVVQAFAAFVDISEGKILDVGSGTDYIPGYLQGHDIKNYVAIDPLPVEKEVPYKRAMALGELMPFADSTFDTVLVATSLDHVLCIDSFFSEIFRVLRDDGRAYIWGSWFFDDSQFANIPQFPLFRRDSEDVIPEDGALEKFEHDSQKLKSFCADVGTLREEYSQYMVDQYHFRHIPINFLREISLRFDFKIEDFLVWDISTNNFVNAFVKLRKCDECQSFIKDKYVPLQYNQTLYLKQEMRSLQSQVNMLQAEINTLQGGVNNLRSEVHDLNNRVEAASKMISDFIYNMSWRVRLRRIFLLNRKVKD
jgi:SAM-dependent methyltransferase